MIVPCDEAGKWIPFVLENPAGLLVQRGDAQTRMIGLFPDAEPLENTIEGVLVKSIACYETELANRF